MRDQTWMNFCLHTHFQAPVFMQRLLEIPPSFPSQKEEHSVTLPVEDVSLFHISHFTHMSSVDSCSSRKHKELPEESFDHGKLMVNRESPPSPTASFRPKKCSLSGWESKFLIQPVSQFADQRGPGENQGTGYSTYNLGWNEPLWGSLPPVAALGMQTKGGGSRR